MSRYILFCMGVVLAATESLAQTPKVEIKKISAGFRPYADRVLSYRCKVGLWTPIYVTLRADNRGVPRKIGADNSYIEIQTKDSDRLGTIYRIPFALGKNQTQTFVAYTKLGETNAQVEVAVYARGSVIAKDEIRFFTMHLNEHQYLTLGMRSGALQSSLEKMAAKKQQRDRRTAPNFANFETDVARLPDVWFGYDGVDMIMLSTANKKFAADLVKDENSSRLAALAKWVRHGGRLVIGIHWKNQDLAARMLKSDAWAPLLPPIVPVDVGDAKKNAVADLEPVRRWAGVEPRHTFVGPGTSIPVARLLQPKQPSWRVLAEGNDGRPFVVQMPYGRGAITLLSFDLDQAEFKNWSGKQEFFESILRSLGSRAFPGDGSTSDLTTQLERALDDFDVPRVSFGWVALFIVIYILVVGPLDYLILKKVFKRLEWTWITFPTIVILVSAVAYFTAYALKGKERKINQVDLVDIDLRTQLDGKNQPAKALAIGNTWFTILSPQIQNYTVGVEPNVANWWGSSKTQPTQIASPVSWMGRPEYSGPRAMRGGSTISLLRRPYAYADDATGIVGVPIPVWTTKSFTAAWESPLPKLPLDASDLTFRQQGAVLSGTIKNNLPFDLTDVWVLYRDYRTELQGTWKAGSKRKIKLTTLDRKGLENWQMLGPRFGMRYTQILKTMLFREGIQLAGQDRNHCFRRIDLSRLLPGEVSVGEDPYLREAIIYARLTPQAGAAESVLNDKTQPVPTLLWLGELPGSGRTRPQISGTIHQETHLRFLVPVRPAGS